MNKTSLVSIVTSMSFHLYPLVKVANGVKSEVDLE